MPERHLVALVRFLENERERAGHAGRGRREIDRRQRLAILRGHALVVRRAGSNPRARSARRAGGNERLPVAPLETDPPDEHADQPRAFVVHRQRVCAAQVHRERRRRLDEELIRRRQIVACMVPRTSSRR